MTNKEFLNSEEYKKFIENIKFQLTKNQPKELDDEDWEGEFIMGIDHFTYGQNQNRKD